MNTEEEEAEKRKLQLKQKIGMLRAILPPFKLAKGAAGAERLQRIELKLEEARTQFGEDKLEEARENTNSALVDLFALVPKLPRVARRIVESGLKRIAKY